MITKAMADKLVNIKGNVRGAAFETDAFFVRSRYGDEGLARVRAELQRLGYPIAYDEIAAMEWRPVGLRALSLLVIRDVFDWKDDDVREMGDAAPKYSFIVKILMKFFVSPGVAFDRVPEYWARHYDVGRLQSVALREDEQHAVVRLHDFLTHTIYCRYLEGFFGRLFKFTFPRSKVTVQETVCMHQGGSMHEFVARWEDEP